MTTTSTQRIMEALGDPVRARGRLHDYREAADAFASVDLAERYSEQWVAAHGDRVVAHSSELTDLLRLLMERGIPRREAHIRYVMKDERQVIV